MSERIPEQQKAIAQVISNERKLRHLTLSRQDVDVLEADNKSLSPLVEFTDALSGEKYVSVLWQPSPKPSGHRIPPISTSQRQRASIASL
jgi:cell shape-determining protein MreC